MDALELVRGVCDKVGWAELSEGTSDSCLCPPPRSSTIQCPGLRLRPPGS